MSETKLPTPLWKKILAGIGLVWGVGFASSFVVGGNDSQKSQAPAATVVASKSKEPTIGELVVIKKQSWELGGFDTVFIANLTIENKNKINLKDFVVECETIGASGTPLSKVRKTVYEVLPAGKTKTFKNISIGFVNSQSKRGICEIIGALPEGYK